jgi:hypothetical protein
MWSVPLALICTAALAGCGSDGVAAPSGNGGLADLVVRVDDDGAKGPNAPRELALRCASPAESEACRIAAGLSAADLAPAPNDRACTQLYGGPDTASISGTLRRRRVDARFSRSDGCEIARWERVQPLLSEVR